MLHPAVRSIPYGTIRHNTVQDRISSIPYHPSPSLYVGSIVEGTWPAQSTYRLPARVRCAEVCRRRTVRKVRKVHVAAHHGWASSRVYSTSTVT